MTPVVFVHGFMGGSEQWQGQVAALSDHPVITLDLPGFGKNAHLDAFESIRANAKWALDALSAQGCRTFHLIGHSMGGMVAQEMVALAQERVMQLVLYGTGATGLLPGRFETIGTSKQRACADGAQATARRISATWFLEQEQSAAYEGCAAIAEQSSMQAILAGLDAMSGWSGVDNLAQIKVTSLIIWGDHDRTYPWSQTEQLWQSIPDANLAVIPGCAHASHLERPTQFNQIMRDFL